ncbi:hypothetical protein [Spongiactinospora sp. TRM90649]|uniref:hypothetical protein n=1 Tax=Spongiactinospora sp. TRM90649 TaxID=3031114 RepID=UPI0023F9FE7C|nr:hypothetical protein [Spongiactinospora sp. TRM90649]MDF5757660.1 hypothetical protein [Spongiactinospora sp. TRM90649]
MKKLLALAGVGAALAGALVTSVPAQAETAETAKTSAAALSPWRYVESFYGWNRWYDCRQVAYQGIRNGWWYNADCREAPDRIDLYVQVTP